MSNHDDLRLLLPGYVLGILDPTETSLVERHLPGCAICREETDLLSKAGDRLAMASFAETPPAGLEERILRALPSPRQSSRRRLQWNFQWSAAAALIVVLAGLNVFQWVNSPANLRAEKAGIGPGQPLGGADLGPPIVQAQAEPRLQTGILHGTSLAAEAYGSIILDPADNHGILAVRDLPGLAAGFVYRLWLVKGDVLVSGGSFGVNSDGYGALMLAVPATAKGFKRLFLTREPAGTAAAPSGPAFMEGSL